MSKIYKFGGLDFIMADLPKGLFVPNVSSLPYLISSWNAHNSEDIEALFEFADGFLIDDAPLLLFLRVFKTVKDNVRIYAASYGIALAKDWWRINELSLCLPTNTKMSQPLLAPLTILSIFIF